MEVSLIWAVKNKWGKKEQHYYLYLVSSRSATVIGPKFPTMCIGAAAAVLVSHVLASELKSIKHYEMFNPPHLSII